MKKTLPVMSVVLLFAASIPAEAQVSARSSAVLEEIQVIAQKKSAAESIQDVPISISALSGEKIEAIFAVDLTDIGQHMPNTHLAPITTFPAVANFVIRGMGTVGQSIPSADPAVGVVMDGISYGTIYGVVTDLFDLEAIEVLRGPQGSLFGRNATGGVVLMRSTRPGEEFKGRLRATAGSHERRDLSLSISGPLADEWGGKLALIRKSHGGFWKNLNPDVNDRQGEARSLLLRSALTWRRGGLDAALLADYGSMWGDGLSARTFWADGVRLFEPHAANETIQGDRGLSDLEWINIVLESNLDLWNGKLTGLFGYRGLEQASSSDIDGLPEVRLAFAPGTRLDSDQLSLELRWSGNLHPRLGLTAGAYLFGQEYEYRERRFLLGIVDQRGASVVEHYNQSIFAQADFSLTDWLVLTLGGRHTWETKDAAIGLIGDPNATGDCATRPAPFEEAAPGLRDCVPALEDKESWRNFSPKVGLTMEIGDNILAFAGYTRGFRSGGYNVRFTDISFAGDNPLSSPGPYGEEVVDAFELGFKSTLWDGRARLNISLFHNEYDDLQRTVLNDAGGQEILNAASATVRGLELDGIAALTERWIVEGSAGWVDATYDEFDAISRLRGVPADSLGFTMVPDFSANLAASYDMPLGSLGALTWRVSFTHVDSVWVNDLNTLRVNGYQLLDASLTFHDSSERWKLALFGRNLSDEVYFHFGIDFSTSALGVQSHWMTPPRTFGAELTYEF